MEGIICLLFCLVTLWFCYLVYVSKTISDHDKELKLLRKDLEDYKCMFRSLSSSVWENYKEQNQNLIMVQGRLKDRMSAIEREFVRVTKNRRDNDLKEIL